MRRVLVFIALSTLSLVLLQGPLRTQAAPQALPPRPTVAPSPTPTVHATDDDDDSPRAGATIELQASTAPAPTWTVVQWQDAQGDWHDVEGWQGTLDDGVKRWWVAPADFRTGPFRWRIYAEKGGDVWGTSDWFDLPASSYEVVTVTVQE